MSGALHFFCASPVIDIPNSYIQWRSPVSTPIGTCSKLGRVGRPADVESSGAWGHDIACSQHPFLSRSLQADIELDPVYALFLPIAQ